jgi:hypothetical protein
MSWMEQQAEHDLKTAMRKSWIKDFIAWIRGEDNDLLPFDAVKHLHPIAEHYRGIQTIPIDKIIGSVDRYRDFDEAFFPRADHLRERWTNIRRLKLEGKELPAIQVYQVGETYFVKDGNHRVSVGHLEGQKYIDAEVTVLEVPIPPEKGDEILDFIIKGEYARFLERTGLEKIVPDHYEILFTTPGRYDILLDHIEKRKYFLGLNLKRDIPYAEAVESWYSRLYKRMVDEMREARALENFPKRTEADLYIFMMDHRYNLSQHYGQDVGSKVAAQSFVQHNKMPWYQRLWEKFMGSRENASRD